MSSAILTSLPAATPRPVVDTDVASFIFKWHPEFAPLYVNIIRGSELVISFVTVSEMHQCSLYANREPRKSEVLKRIWPTSWCSIPTIFCTRLGPRFETRVRGRDDK
jgi:hypothetical protein